MTDRLGLSTVYCIRRLLREETGWRGFRAALDGLGLNAVELNADVPATWLSEVLRDAASGAVAVLSLHNFCPSVGNVPPGKTGFNVFSLSAADDAERTAAVVHTLHTIEWAARFGARVVVHAGEVPCVPTGRDCYEAALRDGPDHPRTKELLQALREERARNARAALDRLRRSLDVVVPRAAQVGVMLGLETRMYPDEIPDMAELYTLLTEYPEDVVGYWHDFGHAEVLTALGFAAGQRAYAAAFGRRTVGYHIHDTRGLRYHDAPGFGDTAFADALIPDGGRAMVLEVHDAASLEQLRRGIAHIRAVLGTAEVTATPGGNA